MGRLSHAQMLPPPQVMTVAAVIAVSMLAPPALGARPDVKCKCFMCVCDLDPHPLPPEVPEHHSPPAPEHHPPPPPVPVASPPPPPPAPVVVPAYYPPPTEHEPAPGYYYYPPMPYGYPWAGTSYGPPAVGVMYPRDSTAIKSAARRQVGGGGLSGLLLAVTLASAVSSVLMRCT
ncbi:hypothetical protein ACP4OV_027369 [Aristida adscensionis]